jgi:Asp/Glu/hydantoin racemase
MSAGEIISALSAVVAAAYTVGRVSAVVGSLKEEIHSLREQVHQHHGDIVELKSWKKMRLSRRAAV